MSEKPNPDLKERYQAASKFASELEVAVGYKEFTVYDLVNNSNMGHEESKRMLSILMDFGMVEVVPDRDKHTFKVDMNRESMIKRVEEMKRMAVDEIKRVNEIIREYDHAIDFIKAEVAKKKAIDKEIASRGKKAGKVVPIGKQNHVQKEDSPAKKNGQDDTDS